MVLLADEAFYAGDKKHESILKRIVTEETIMIEAKGDDWVVPAGLEERRFLVLDVGESQMQNSEFFGALDRELESGGREALLHLLLNRDLSGFNVRRFPQTEALREQQAALA